MSGVGVGGAGYRPRDRLSSATNRALPDGRNRPASGLQYVPRKARFTTCRPRVIADLDVEQPCDLYQIGCQCRAHHCLRVEFEHQVIERGPEHRGFGKTDVTPRPHHRKASGDGDNLRRHFPMDDAACGKEEAPIGKALPEHLAELTIGNLVLIGGCYSFPVGMGGDVEISEVRSEERLDRLPEITARAHVAVRGLLTVKARYVADDRTLEPTIALVVRPKGLDDENIRPGRHAFPPRV